MSKNGSLIASEILIVDDEEDIRDLIAGILHDEGYSTRVAGDSESALAAIRARRPQLVVLDIWLQGSKLDGIEVLDAIKREQSDLPVVMISGHGTIETAVASLKKGAYDFVEKPCKADLFELAHNGTLYLDEVADMPLGTQGKILRVLIDQTFTRVGGQVRVQVDARVICSTTRDLRAETEAGRFREDLYHRLNVVPVRIPSLAERRDDIPVLVTHFMKRLSAAGGLPMRIVGEDAMAVLQTHGWPGNVRQLRNIV